MPLLFLISDTSQAFVDSILRSELIIVIANCFYPPSLRHGAILLPDLYIRTIAGIRS